MHNNNNNNNNELNDTMKNDISNIQQSSTIIALHVTDDKTKQLLLALSPNDDNSKASLSNETLSTSTPPTTTSTVAGSSSSSSCSYPKWHNTVSGAVAGAGSRMVTAPLDLIRIRRQLMTSGIVTYQTPTLYRQICTIIETEGGIRALYRGNLAAMYLWISYASVQFTIYNTMKDAIQTNGVLLSTTSSTTSSSSTTTAFISGAVAGVIATSVTYPFDVCRTIFMAFGKRMSSSTTTTVPTTNKAMPRIGEPPRSIYDFVTQLYNGKGIRGFYAGSFPAIVQIVPYMGLNFAIYDRLTSRPTSENDDDNNSSKSTSVLLSAYAGSISGGVSKVVTYPLDTVKRRLQAQAFFSRSDTVETHSTTSSSSSLRHRSTPLHHHHHHTTYNGMIDCFRTTYQQEGFFSFYRGMVPSVLKTAISTSLTFALYRCTKNILEGIHDHNKNQLTTLEF